MPRWVALIFPSRKRCSGPGVKPASTTAGMLDTSMPVDKILNCIQRGCAKSSVDDLIFSQGDVSARAAFILRDVESKPDYDVAIWTPWWVSFAFKRRDTERGCSVVSFNEATETWIGLWVIEIQFRCWDSVAKLSDLQSRIQTYLNRYDAIIYICWGGRWYEGDEGVSVSCRGRRVLDVIFRGMSPCNIRLDWCKIILYKSKRVDMWSRPDVLSCDGHFIFSKSKRVDMWSHRNGVL